MDGAEVAERLGLVPLPDEGGLFRRTYADDAGAAIYYLLVAPARSALHRLDVAEVWHHYAGAPARLLLLEPDGGVAQPVLGADLERGQRPQVAVPAGVWQAAETTGQWTLMGCTTAPPFTPSAFTLGDPDELARGWPRAAERIHRLGPSS